MKAKTTSLRIDVGRSETYIYSEVTYAELQKWLSDGLAADEIALLALARKGSLFYRESQNLAMILYRPDKSIRLKFWHEGQECASVQEFTAEV